MLDVKKALSFTVSLQLRDKVLRWLLDSCTGPPLFVCTSAIFDILSHFGFLPKRNGGLLDFEEKVILRIPPNCGPGLLTSGYIWIILVSISLFLGFLRIYLHYYDQIAARCLTSRQKEDCSLAIRTNHSICLQEMWIK